MDQADESPQANLTTSDTVPSFHPQDAFSRLFSLPRDAVWHEQCNMRGWVMLDVVADLKRDSIVPMRGVMW